MLVVLVLAESPTRGIPTHREPKNHSALVHSASLTILTLDPFRNRGRAELLCKGYSSDTTPRLFGFLLGTATAGAGMYYYVIDEYRVSNQLLTEDIYALQSAVQRIEGYVRTLEEKVGEKRR